MAGRFAHVLRRAEIGLRVPEPGHSLLLLEMAGDLEGLYAAYRARGLDEAEAARRAREVIAASDDAARELERMHAPPLTRWLVRIGARRANRAERMLLTGLTLLAIGGGLVSLVAAGVAESPSRFLWPVLAIAAACAWTCGALALELFVRPAEATRIAASGRRLGRLLGLAATCVVLGLLGAVIEIQSGARVAHAAIADAPATAHAAQPSARVAEAGALPGARASAGGATLWLPYFRRGVELLGVALIVTLAVLLAWAHLQWRLAAIRAARAELMLTTRSTPSPGGNP